MDIKTDLIAGGEDSQDVWMPGTTRYARLKRLEYHLPFVSGADPKLFVRKITVVDQEPRAPDTIFSR